MRKNTIEIGDFSITYSEEANDTELSGMQFWLIYTRELK